MAPPTLTRFHTGDPRDALTPLTPTETMPRCQRAPAPTLYPAEGPVNPAHSCAMPSHSMVSRASVAPSCSPPPTRRAIDPELLSPASRVSPLSHTLLGQVGVLRKAM